MLEKRFSTREPGLYKKLYQVNIRGEETKTDQLLIAPIGNANISLKIEFCSEAPVLKYHQQLYNRFFLSLASAFNSIGDNRAATSFANPIEE